MEMILVVSCGIFGAMVYKLVSWIRKEWKL